MNAAQAALRAIQNFSERGDAQYAMSLYRLFNTENKEK